MDTSILLNFILGAYGAGLTTYNIVKANKEKSRRLSVKISYGIPTYGDRLGDQGILVTIANPGNRTVTVGSPCIKLPDDSSIVLLEPLGPYNFPLELLEGKNCMAYAGLDGVKQTLIEHGYTRKIKLKANVEDGAGKEYWSKNHIEFDVTERD